ncbi:RND family transporter [Segniliparus rugosus]|uniref:Membrane transport protein MMPL domain-containing protein n=1 Tax=Segniliparus rugosus (strain ATCC BAA-974 / DSM 45345 / CCUG 50838 / CIP 108380 / JCM 13579 / CDC 945) TaxID=679197 RepID=E5XNJ7_SEGRC|nr:RND family transporter [Segniliparus rugosus]EFV14109.1 hypothetical protein HMPREF9336_01026 [Segniliparus rugosus ATCC BAA-974]
MSAKEVPLDMEHAQKRTFFAKTIRALAVPLVIFWALAAIGLVMGVPSLAKVTEEHAGAVVPMDAPGQRALVELGKQFHGYDSTASLMIVLETPGRVLDEGDRAYYIGLVRRMEQDKKHVRYVMDFWGKTVTAASAQSEDGKAAYVSVTLAGNIGEALANESVSAVRDIVNKNPPPAGLKVYVSGAAPIMTDLLKVGTASMEKVLLVTVAVIVGMLLIVYRSIFTMLFALITVLCELMIGNQTVAALVEAGLIGTSSFATAMVANLIMGAGTDYCIFLVGRYHEARLARQSREDAYYTAFQGVAPVILGSGLTIAGASYCLSFARLDYFKTMGPACAVAMLVAVLAALTLGPALLVVGNRFGLFEPKRKAKTRLYRRIGASVVRWPAPILAASCAVVMVGAVFVPTYAPKYNDLDFQPPNTPANEGFLAADRHFAKGKLNSEILLIEADHDIRNPADFIALENVSKKIFHTPGVELVQSITRGQGRPMDFSSLAQMISQQASGQGLQLPFTKAGNDASDLRLEMNKRMNAVAYELAKLTAKQNALNKAIAENTDNNMVPMMQDMVTEIGTLDDFIRPLRAYFYWETNCYDLPWCWVGRSMFDMLDSIDKMSESMAFQATTTDELNALAPQLAALTKTTNDMTAALNSMQDEDHGRSQLSNDQTEQNLKDSLDIGKDFNKSGDDSTFYISKDVFANPDFKLALGMLVSPDGKTAELIITHEGEAQSAEGIKHVQAISSAAREAVKGTSLANSKIYLGGAGTNARDIEQYVESDLTIAAITAFALIFLIMLTMTGSIGAALTILFTVAFSFLGALGLSVLAWQDVIGLPLHWMVMPISFILLVAVGSDYNMLLISRMKEEIHGGLKTGLIRSLGSTGGVVTSAGMVFAFTMLSMVPNEMKVMPQLGSTICVGLLLDTFVVRTFIVPAIARILGPWFWWPRVVRWRPRHDAPR